LDEYEKAKLIKEKLEISIGACEVKITSIEEKINRYTDKNTIAIPLAYLLLNLLL
jgi:hypothetical protein